MTERTIRMTAKELAGDFYDEAGKSERFRALWPDASTFIARNWPNYVEPARKILAKMLSRKDISDAQKQAIHAALVEDRMKAKTFQPRPQLHLNPAHPGRLERKVFHDG